MWVTLSGWLSTALGFEGRDGFPCTAFGTGTPACSSSSGSMSCSMSRQLGHANANVTLSVYAHVFAQREHGEVARQALEASYTAMREVGRP
jgi:hypothetical protein